MIVVDANEESIIIFSTASQRVKMGRCGHFCYSLKQGFALQAGGYFYECCHCYDSEMRAYQPCNLCRLGA